MSEARNKKSALPTAGTMHRPALDEVLSATFRVRGAQQENEARRDLETLVAELTNGVEFGSKRADLALRDRIAEIDRILSQQVAAIMHQPKFQQLEGSFRGLHRLVHDSNTNTRLKIHVLAVSKSELAQDAKDAPEFDQSELFKKVYERAYGQFGGQPYACLIGDYEWDHSHDDMTLLKRMASVAAAAHAPFISAAAPALLGLQDYTQLNEPRDLSLIFEGKAYAKWRSFRQEEDSRYVALTLPRVMARMPYGKTGQRIDAFEFEEGVDGKNHNAYVWSNAAYAFGARLADAFDRHGWCVAVRGVEGGGLVQGLPTHTFAGPQGDDVLKCPTEVLIPDRREAELYKLGFMPILHRKDTPEAAFLGAQSTRKLKTWSTPAANGNERLSAQIPYLMAVARFAHYMKAILRDKVGGFAESIDVERYLNKWISRYVLIDDGASPGMKAKYPLRQARVDVRDKSGMPGYYEATIYIRPHFQLEEVDASIRLVAELPPPTKSS